jgi:hypothetical protein
MASGNRGERERKRGRGKFSQCAQSTVTVFESVI